MTSQDQYYVDQYKLIGIEWAPDQPHLTELSPHIDALLKKYNLPRSIDGDVDFSQWPPTALAEIRETAAKLRRNVAVRNPDSNEAKLERLQEMAEVAETVEVDVTDVAGSPPPATQPQTGDAKPAATADTLGSKLTNCPRCHYDLSQAYTVVPTESDRDAIRISLLGGAAFEKTFETLGGRMSATFRELTPDEQDAVEYTNWQDALADRAITPLAMTVRQMQMLCMLSLRRVVMDGQVIYTTTAPASQVLLGTHAKTLWSKGFKTAFLRDVVFELYQQFGRVLAGLYAQTREPSFWHGGQTSSGT